MRHVVIPDSFLTLLSHQNTIAVALSGGPDSMALLHMLSAAGGRIHALTVDHALRPESAREAKEVGAWIAGWPNVEHHILKWTGAKPKEAVMERAREARYRLMHKYCAKAGIGQLWLAHQQTDQAETFLFRLAKGSGVDGLGGMMPVQAYRDTELQLVRPLLAVSKADLEAYCRKRKIPYVTDPTNTNVKYAHTRLRQALPILEAEGLSEKRLAMTAKRMQRAREALDFYADRIVKSANLTEGRAELSLAALLLVPMEIRIRAIRRCLSLLGANDYGPRLERLEQLLEIFFVDRKRFTLGGFLFSSYQKGSLLLIEKQGSQAKGF